MNILSTFISDKLEPLNILEAIDFAVKQHHEELEDLNTMQLDNNMDMEGKSLGRGKFMVIDLKKTGDWRRSQKVTSNKGVIDMTATNWKTRILIEGEGRQRGFGDDILGIPRKDIDSGEVSGILLDSIIFEVKRQINV
jgi:hypothetical protein